MISVVQPVWVTVQLRVTDSAHKGSDRDVLATGLRRRREDTRRRFTRIEVAEEIECGVGEKRAQFFFLAEPEALRAAITFLHLRRARDEREFSTPRRQLHLLQRHSLQICCPSLPVSTGRP